MSLPDAHVAEPDLMGDCTVCGLPEANRVHLHPDPPAVAPTPADQFQTAIPAGLTADTPLSVVIQWLRENVADGAHCPACTQFAKVYRRKINSGMARALIEMYRHAGTEWFYLPRITDRWQGRDEAGLRYWGLTEESTEPRDDGGRAGWWRVTPDGEQYVRNALRLPTYAEVYNGRCLGLTGDPATIRDALGTKFNYDDLMSGV